MLKLATSSCDLIFKPESQHTVNEMTLRRVRWCSGYAQVGNGFESYHDYLQSWNMLFFFSISRRILGQEAYLQTRLGRSLPSKYFPVIHRLRNSLDTIKHT
jgi:hypothetical protein